MDEEIAEVIREYGWYCANVNDANPPFLFTIGLIETLRHPELIVFGLDAENGYALLVGLIAEMQNGKSYSENGVQTIELGDSLHQIGFRRVDPTQHPCILDLRWGLREASGESGS